MVNQYAIKVLKNSDQMQLQSDNRVISKMPVDESLNNGVKLKIGGSNVTKR